MTSCAILSIGEEILEGSILDTNSNYLSRILTTEGFSVNQIRVLPDNMEELILHLKDVSNKYPLIITTGGLGSTFDDITRQAIGKLIGKKLYFNEKAYEKITNNLKKRNRKVLESHKRQALFPEESILFENSVGLADGFGTYFNKSFIVCLPGVPYEMKYIFTSHILPFLKEHFDLHPIFMKDLHFAGTSESYIDEIITNLELTKELKVVINVSNTITTVRLRGTNKVKVEETSNLLIEKLNEYYFGTNEESLEKVVVERLKEQCLTLSVAESCTAGLLAFTITNIPGSSSVFKGGVIVYSNEAKETLLHINHNLLEEKGAVSPEVAFEMAKNTKDVFNTNIGIGITGIAGPSGGTPTKPVGLVYIGLAFNNNISVYKNIFPNSRNMVRKASTVSALMKLYNLMRGIG